MSKTVRVRIEDRWYTVEVGDLDANPIRTVVDGDPVEVDIGGLVLPEGVTVVDEALIAADPVPIETPAEEEVDEVRESDARPASVRAPQPRKEFYVPLAGIIVSVNVEAGDQVVTGDDICVLEAMKMHQTLRADWSGIVKSVHVQPGQQVHEGDLIVELE